MFSETGYYTHPELPELYDYVPLYNSRRDVTFYVDLCREMGEVLELGCGTGRVLLAALKPVVPSRDSITLRTCLARCRAKADGLSRLVRDRITLVEADMTNFQLARKFKLAIVPFRSIQPLATPEELIHLLPELSGIQASQPVFGV